jgi:hypothetical protein
MGCLWRLFRLLILAVIVVAAIVLLLPKFFAQAGNTVLSSINSSGNPFSGVVEFAPANTLDKKTKLQVSFSGLDANTKYDVTLDPDSCNSAGSVNAGQFTTDSNGNVTTIFSLSSLSKAVKNWYVNLHSGPDPSYSSTACSQLNTNDSTTASDANNIPLQLSPSTTNMGSSQITSGSTSSTTSSSPQGFPNTGVAPGGNSYDNNVYPRKF